MELETNAASPADAQNAHEAPALKQPGIKLDLSYVDQKSSAYRRFKSWVDAAVAGEPGYAFSASDAAILYRLNPKPAYCRLAVEMVEQQVADAEKLIASGSRPDISGDSYLYVGPGIADLALTMDTCGKDLVDGQRERWSRYAERTVWNVWNHESARWGDHAFAWSGWATDNPGNNYFYSFVEATMYWALASGSQKWMALLRDEKLPMLQAYFARLPGGGSLEGTGYGASHMSLFALYRLWRDATGEDLANANSHANDSIGYWAHATVPTMDRFAPIGDQSRSSVPEIYDYHRRIVLEARHLSKDAQSRELASWWLNRISIQEMSGFNSLYALLPSGSSSVQPQGLFHHAKGTGHLFARSSWDKDAMWLAVMAGPYNESHAHQQQGGFTLFARDWLTVSENIWTHSGIQQGTETNNVLRFERTDGRGGRHCAGEAGDPVVHQCLRESGGGATMEVRQGDGDQLVVEADLTPAYGGNPAVASWQRRFEFGGRRLVVRDSFSTGPATHAIFQLNLPDRPHIDGSQATAGKLRIRVLEPANASLSVHDWRSVDAKEFPGGWRLDIAGGDHGYVVELSEIDK